MADFTHCLTGAGFAYVAVIVDCHAQNIVTWHVARTKTTGLVLTALRIALWGRGREGRAVVLGQLINHQ